MGEKLVSGRILGGEEALVFFALGVEQNHSGEAFDFVFLSIRLVLGGQLFVTAREVEFDEDKVFGRCRGEFLLRENLSSSSECMGDTSPNR